MHVPLLYEPPTLSVATVTIEDGVSLREVQMSELPSGWNRYPAAGILADLGSAWVRSVASLLLRVPSAVVAGEFDVRINQAHHEMAHVRIAEIRPYAFDPRFVTRGNRKA
ncbi:hypothetical protein JXA88_19300 [Candidatus Fermentibacteria bacterium]|nr:hypothetical protein [Candidatus Fermentibacteria bacterium]